MAQIKIVAPEHLVNKFKQIVVIKHGKLELGAEGEEAIRLYVQKHEQLLKGPCPPEADPLNKIIGIAKSKLKTNVLKDLKKLDSGEL
ncbi:MAG: hypothetical protein HY929_04400 [Euryarchaeota archaeon]|nr:hypothetical protein [Euryarchaeota archaeon]